MIKKEIMDLVDRMTEDELAEFRDEIITRLRNREAEKVPPAEDNPEE